MLAEGDACEAAYVNRHTVHYVQAVVGAGDFRSQPAPDQLLEVPEISGLPGESNAVGLCQGWKEVREVEGKDVCVGVRPQELAHALHHQHLGVGEPGHAAALLKALGVQPLARDHALIISCNKYGYN